METLDQTLSDKLFPSLDDSKLSWEDMLSKFYDLTSPDVSLQSLVGDLDTYLTEPSQPQSSLSSIPSSSALSSVSTFIEEPPEFTLSPSFCSSRSSPFLESQIPAAKLLFRCELAKTALEPSLDISRALSRPAFAPDQTGRFVCGTEDQTPDRLYENRLILAKVVPERVRASADPIDSLLVMDNDYVNDVRAYALPDHVRDVHWVNETLAVVVVGSRIMLLNIDEDLEVTSEVMLPQFHTDLIREVCISQQAPHNMLSGGFDGKVFVSDITRLSQDILDKKHNSENNVLDIGEVISSLTWHLDDPHRASFTTDAGGLYLFDTRTGTDSCAYYHVGKTHLYCHAYRDQNILLLGFGDGEIQVYDVRKTNLVECVRDPCQRQIGELRFDPTRTSMATFGIPDVSIWRADEILEIRSHVGPDILSFAVEDFKTSGEYMPFAQSPLLAVTDSAGQICFYSGE